MIKTLKRTKKTKVGAERTTLPKIETVNPEPANGAPAQPAATKAAQPKINHVAFELVKADARRVCVAGSFNQWQPEKTPLAPAGGGKWVGELNVTPGRYEYLFVVDGQWLPDPNAKESVQNPFGGRNSVLVASA
jgi:1,4-alpha-glucan branching enzyme